MSSSPGLLDLTSTPEEIEAHQEHLLAMTLHRIYERHPYYRSLMIGIGADPRDYDTFASFPSFPITSKEDFVSAPEAFRLDPGPEGSDDYVLWDVAYTSGTSTGLPTPMYQTSFDFRSLMLAQARMASIRGMGKSDRIMNLYPLTTIPHGAWLRCNQAAAAIGASVTAGLSGRRADRYPATRTTEDVVELTVASDPTVLWGVPSFVRRVLLEIASNGRELPSLRMTALSGEPCPPAMRQSLERLAMEVGAGRGFVVSDSLGATELQCGLVECIPGAGFHNPAPELFHLSTVDENGNVAPPGEAGSLLMTHLDRRGTVLLRFKLGDRVILSYDPCVECGRVGGRVVEHLGRAGRYAKARGNLIDIGEITKAVSQVHRVVEFQIVIRNPEGDSLGLDELVIRTVVEGSEGVESVVEEVIQAVERVARIVPVVEIVDRSEIWSEGSSMKPARFVDSRDGAEAC